MSNWSETLLHQASFHDQPECMTVLLQVGGVDIDKVCNGKTALHVAISFTCVSILLDHGANVNARDSNGCTALWLAAEAESLRVADLLARRGANEDLAADDGSTPMDIARESDFDEYINRFDKRVRAQVRHSIKDEDGDTAMKRVLQGDDTAWYIKQFL